MQVDFEQENRENQALHEAALAWRARLTMPHSVAWLRSRAGAEPGFDARSAGRAADRVAARLAIRGVFAGHGIPADSPDGEILLLRDPLGRPYASWSGTVAAWAELQGLDDSALHISNTNDGGVHIVLAAHAPELVGLGVDAVALDRLRMPGKGRDYLLRFCRQFMGPNEWELFAQNSRQDGDEALRQRAAAHFSLMEAASKACGTGLRIGAGMGKPTSLPKQALGVRRLAPEVELLFGAEADERLAELGAVRYEAFWGADSEFLVSVVLLYRAVQ